MGNCYIPMYRPAGYATMPRGLRWEYVEAPTMSGLCVRTDIPRSSHRFGVIRTDRPLTKDEMAIYELKEQPND